MAVRSCTQGEVPPCPDRTVTHKGRRSCSFKQNDMIFACLETWRSKGSRRKGSLGVEIETSPSLRRTYDQPMDVVLTCSWTIRYDMMFACRGTKRSKLASGEGLLQAGGEADSCLSGCCLQLFLPCSEVQRLRCTSGSGTIV